MLVRAHLAVLAAAVLFGTTFVSVQEAVAEVEPVPFLAARFLLAAAVVLPFARRRPSQPGIGRAGALCGVALLAGYLFQTVGLQYTTSTTSAFITYLLVVLVPVIAAVVGRRLPAPAVMVGVGLSVVGLLLLTGGGDGLGVGRGELLTLGCALGFAIHIVLLAEYAPRFDTVRLNALQLAVVGGACLVPGFALGGYDFSLRAWVAVAWTAIAASAVAFALQVWGQRRVGPTRTALLLMMEPVAAAFLGWVLGERLGPVAAVGAVLILAGILVAELRPVDPTVEASTP